MITLINLHLQNASSIFVPNGSISFSLNVDSTVIAAPGGFVSSAVPVVFQLDANGNLIQPCKIWSNEELNPQLSPTLLGTFYLVSIRDQNGAAISQPMWWQFPNTIGSTVDISQITPISTVGGNIIFYPTNFGGGGGGSVTSVTFTGDGIILASTPSTAVTTSGTVLATLLTQSANLVLAGPTTGAAHIPTFRSLVTADMPATVALLASPTFTGTVTIPILAVTTSETVPSISINGGTAITGQTGTGGIVAMSASPALTGTPTAPTAAPGTSTTQLATTAFVQAGSATPQHFYQSANQALGNTVQVQPAQNGIKISPFYISYPLSVSTISYAITNADNSANVYDIGIYGPGALGGAVVSLAAHTGSLPGTTVASTTGPNIPIAIVGGPVTLQPGWYAFAVTTSAAGPSAQFGGNGTATYLTPYPHDTALSGGGATLPSTITAPATSYNVSAMIEVGLF